MPWRYARSRQSYLPRGGARTDNLARPIQYRPKTSAVSCRIASCLRRFPRPRTAHKLLHADEFKYVYFRLVRIPRILGCFEIVKRVECLIGNRRENVFAGLIWHGCLTSPFLFQISNIAYYIRDFRASLVLHM